MGMELIYAYLNIKSRKVNFDINFTSNYKCKYSDNYLTIEETKSENMSIYSNNIDSMKLIVGKNGRGKTTLLDVIAGTKEERLSMYHFKDQWLLVYHIKDNYFKIEKDNLILKDVDFGKIPDYSYYVKCENGKFVDTISLSNFKNDNVAVSSELINAYNADNLTSYYLQTTLSIGSELNNHGIMISTEEYESSKRKIVTFNWLGMYDFLGKGFLKKLDFYSDDKKMQFLTNPIIRENEYLYENRGNYIVNQYRNGNYKYELYQVFIINFLEVQYSELCLLCLEDKYTRALISREELIEMRPDLSNVDDYETKKGILLKSLKRLYNKTFLQFNRVEFDNIKLYEFISSIEENHDFIEFESPSRFIISKYKCQNVRDIITAFNNLNIDKNVFSEHQFFSFFHMPECSSGEKRILEILSCVLAISDTSDEKIQLVMDEPDLVLHPEWSRKLIFYIAELIKKSDKKFSIIMTSHSPYLVSDFSKSDIFILDGNSSEMFVKQPENGFACNIGDALVETFYLSSPIGEYANHKIKNVFSDINKCISNNQRNEEIYIAAKNMEEEISNVFLKDSLGSLLKKYEEKFLSLDEIDLEIEKYEEKLRYYKDLRKVNNVKN